MSLHDMEARTSETVGHRVCAETERGDLMVRCWCGNLRPAKREHGWTKETAPLVAFAARPRPGDGVERLP